MTNLLYYGDNLDVLRRYVEDESADLIYLDPPFNSNQDYNVLFVERGGARSAAQIKAFEDTWAWDQVAAEAYQEVVEAGGKVSQVMQAFRTFLGASDLLAYLAMMAPRLVELRRVLKPTGSIYLHCDPTASHYLKLLMDAVFGPTQFRNEIIWQRTSAHSLVVSMMSCSPMPNPTCSYGTLNTSLTTKIMSDHITRMSSRLQAGDTASGTSPAQERQQKATLLMQFSVSRNTGAIAKPTWSGKSNRER
jgi:DNA modification methylase